MTHQAYLVPPHVRCVDGQAIAAPHKFEVKRALVRAERLESPPEPPNDLVTAVTVWIRRDSFEALHLNSLLSTRTDLDCRRRQVGD